MDTYIATETDALGRRGGPRRRRSVEEKRRIVQEALQPGASVAVVARRNDLNANVLFLWRSKYLKGEMGAPSSDPPLIPVKLVDPDQESVSARPREYKPCAEDIIELKTAAGVQLKVSGALVQATLREILAQVLGR